MDFVSCPSRQQMAIYELLTQQRKVRGNSGPGGFLLPSRPCHPHRSRRPMAWLLAAPCPFHTGPGELSWGIFFLQAIISTATSPPPAPPFHQPFIFCLLSLAAFLPSFRSRDPLTSGESGRGRPKELPTPELAPSMSYGWGRPGME